MRKSFTTFAATLAAAGLLCLGSVSIGQDTPEPNQPAPPATEQAPENVADPASDNPETAQRAAETNAESADNSVVENNNAPSQPNAEQQDKGTADDANQPANEQGAEQNAEQPANDEQSEANDKSADQREQQASNKDDESNVDSRQDLNTPPVPEQARDRAANSDAPRDADWRMVGYQNQWWYYSPQGQWLIRQGNQWRPYQSANIRTQRTYDDSRMMTNRQTPQRYSTGYRGDDAALPIESQAGAAGQSATPVRYDRCGRAFICENGRRVYVQVDDQAQPYTSNRYSTSDAQPTLAEESDRNASNDMSGDADDVGRPTPARDELRSVPPAPPKAE